MIEKIEYILCLLIIIPLLIKVIPLVHTSINEIENQHNYVTETKTVPIVFKENIIENVNGGSTLGNGSINTRNDYTVYKILDDGSKKLYPIDSNKTIIYDTLNPDAQEYLEEDYNYHGYCLAIRIYTHKWDS